MLRRRQLLLISIVLVSVGIAGLGVGAAVADTQEQEPNDDFGSAQPVPEGNVTGEVVDGESDFYRIDANDTDALAGELVERDGDVNLVLYGPDRERLAGDSFRGVTSR